MLNDGITILNTDLSGNVITSAEPVLSTKSLVFRDGNSESFIADNSTETSFIYTVTSPEELIGLIMKVGPEATFGDSVSLKAVYSGNTVADYGIFKVWPSCFYDFSEERFRKDLITGIELHFTYKSIGLVDVPLALTYRCRA